MEKLTPEDIANICISAGFTDYEPDKYCTIRIRKAIIRAIEAERAPLQMAESSQSPKPGLEAQGHSTGASVQCRERGEHAGDGTGEG